MKNIRVYKNMNFFKLYYNYNFDFLIKDYSWERNGQFQFGY